MQLTEEVVAPNPGSNPVIEILFADWFSDSVGMKVRVCLHVIVSRTSSLLVNIEWHAGRAWWTLQKSRLLYLKYTSY